MQVGEKCLRQVGRYRVHLVPAQMRARAAGRPRTATTSLNSVHLVNPGNVRKAMNEYDTLGPERFIHKYSGYGPIGAAKRYMLMRERTRSDRKGGGDHNVHYISLYPSKAMVIAAYIEENDAYPWWLSGGISQPSHAVWILCRLGFPVYDTKLEKVYRRRDAPKV